MSVSSMPASVVWFERIAYLSIILSAASLPLNAATLVKYSTKYPITYPITIVVVFAIQVFWIWLIARKRKNWARWITVVLEPPAIVSQVLEIDARFRLGVPAAIAYYAISALWAFAVVLLVIPDAGAWFHKRDASSVSL